MRKKIYLINELPHIYELEDMIQFCSRYSKLYIYGCAEKQEWLLKYFDMCQIKINGYVVTYKIEKNEFIYRELPIVQIDEIIDEKETGIIMGLSDKYYGKIIPMFREKGFHHYFIMSEYNKRAIACQVRPRDREEFQFEVSLADHCNISCQMCDHFSQLSEEYFQDYETYEKDIRQLGKVFDHKIGLISFLGGEPLLNNEIIKFLKVTREQFPDGELLILTNGIKLLEWEHSEYGNLWEACRKYDIHITVTVYPIKLDYLAIEKKAEEYGIGLAMSSNIHAHDLTRAVKISDKHTMDLSGGVDRFYCVNCLYFNKFSVLKDGRIYMCPIEAHSNIFNKKFNQELKIRQDDYLDIYKIESWKDISEFSSKYVPFCSYCDLKHWGHYSEWKASTKKIEEYI